MWKVCWDPWVSSNAFPWNEDAPADLRTAWVMSGLAFPPGASKCFHRNSSHTQEFASTLWWIQSLCLLHPFLGFPTLIPSLLHSKANFRDEISTSSPLRDQLTNGPLLYPHWTTDQKCISPMSLGLFHSLGLDKIIVLGRSTETILLFPKCSWCAVVTPPLSFSVSLVLVHLLFFLGTQLVDKFTTARKQTATAIFPSSKELVGVCL